MKVGFYGSIANNTYVAATSFTRQGVDVNYIRDFCDNFPFSQPVWQDCKFTLPYDNVNYQDWPFEKWAAMEKQLDWKKPNFVVTPKFGLSGNERPKLRKMGLLSQLLARHYLQESSHRYGVIARMQECDVILACDIEAQILAWLSGVPYVLLPCGGDLIFAGGLVPLKGNNIKHTLHNYLQFHLLNQAYDQCLTVVAHDPDGSLNLGGRIKWERSYFPIPMERQSNTTETQRTERLEQVFNALNLPCPPKDKIIIFIPSRLDYRWKATDRLVNVLAENEQYDNVHFIFSGWGTDYRDALHKIGDYTNVTFLPCILSKPLLFDLYKSSHLVIDQFKHGMYGTSAIEAMTCGIPIMMNVTLDHFKTSGWEPPPVIQAETQDQIRHYLDEINSGKFDLKQQGRLAHEWILRTHDESVSVPRFMALVEEKMKSKDI